MRKKTFNQVVFWRIYDNYINDPRYSFRKELKEMLKLNSKPFSLTRPEKKWYHIFAWECLEDIRQDGVVISEGEVVVVHLVFVNKPGRSHEVEAITLTGGYIDSKVWESKKLIKRFLPLYDADTIKKSLLHYFKSRNTSFDDEAAAFDFVEKEREFWELRNRAKAKSTDIWEKIAERRAIRESDRRRQKRIEK